MTAAVNAGPAKSDAVVTSSVTSRLGGTVRSGPVMISTTKRKLPAGSETLKSVSMADGDGGSYVMKLNMKATSSVRSRLGDPVTDYNGQQRVMIATKRTRLDETAADAAVQSMPERSNVNLPIKARLGEQVTLSSQSQQARVMIPTTKRFAAAGEDEKLGYGAAAKYKTVFGRLGPTPM